MLSFVPQIIKSFKTKSIKDVSELTLFQICAGSTLWIVYGIHLKDFIIIIANVVTLITLTALLVLYVRYRRRVK